MRSFGMACLVAGAMVTSNVAQAAPLVATGQGQVQLVKKKAADSGGDSGEKGWFEYLKMALTFDDSEVSEQVQDGRVVEHLVGGLLANFGGHLWGPKVFYKDAPEEVPGATVLGIVSIILGWLPFAFWIGYLFAVIPVLGWAIAFLCFLAFWVALAVDLAFNFWFIPRALQFAYSDAYGGAGSGGGKKKKKKAAEDDED